MLSALAFVIKIISPIFSYEAEKVSFPQPKKFSLIKDLFPKSRKFSAVKKISHKKNYLIKEIFHSQGMFSQKYFLRARNFSTNKDFYTDKKKTANKDQKGSLKPKILDPFNTKCYTKIFLAL